MPILRVPNVISYYTDKQTQFEVSGSTALEAVQSAVEKFPGHGLSRILAMPQANEAGSATPNVSDIAIVSVVKS